MLSCCLSVNPSIPHSFPEKNIFKLVNRLNESSKYEVSLLYSGDSLAHIEVYDYASGGGFDIFIK